MGCLGGIIFKKNRIKKFNPIFAFRRVLSYNKIKNMRKIDILRKKYPRFVYKSYSYKITGKNLEIFFDFKIRDISFKPRIIIKNIGKKQLALLEKGVLNNFIFHLGMMEIPSYWKTTCSPIIEVKAGYLSKEQIKWWKDFIVNGMGQFFYENKINFTKPNFFRIISNQQRFNGEQFSVNLTENCSPLSFAKNRVLIPMGVGKDSIVTLELLKQEFGKSGVNCFIVNPAKNHFQILKIPGIEEPIIVERKIDPLLLKLYKQGFLNGHTPITALISNLAVFTAVLFGFNYVALSCERSANEENIKYLGKTINHQWSKSFEFEKKFRNYLDTYLINYSLIRANKRVKKVNYFSFLRPLYEIQIAKIFSNFPQYFSSFLSCNEARKTKSGTKKATGQWCGNCSKCLFIFSILYPFIDEKRLIKIFGQNLFEKKELLPIMKQLLKKKETKPFECVGTKKESLIAFYLSWEKAKNLNFSTGVQKVKFSLSSLPPLLEYFEKQILPKYPNLEKQSEKMMNSWNKQNYVPKELEKALKLKFKN